MVRYRFFQVVHDSAYEYPTLLGFSGQIRPCSDSTSSHRFSQRSQSIRHSIVESIINDALELGALESQLLANGSLVWTGTKESFLKEFPMEFTKIS